LHENLSGVEVVRVPILSKLSKGVIMPSFAWHAGKLVRHSDAINIHMPQMEAPLLALLAKRRSKRTVVTYHCDLKLPGGLVNRFVAASLPPLNAVAARAADAIVVNSLDYAEHSPFLRCYLDKVRAILPPIEVPDPDPAATDRLRATWSLDRGPCIGFAARFASEKGVEYLLRALPNVVAQEKGTRVLFTGAYKDTVGEEDYWRRLQPLMDACRNRLVFLDLLRDEEMPSFFSLCDVLAVTSLNSTESFGLVQAEAMLCGTPVVATDLPGVREAVRLTGMGRIVPPRDPEALANALLDVIRNRNNYKRPEGEIAARFDIEASLSHYEAVFQQAPRS
jgi:glycosyltransferase involved in cell wall biosynthesis